MLAVGKHIACHHVADVAQVKFDLCSKPLGKAHFNITDLQIHHENGCPRAK